MKPTNHGHAPGAHDDRHNDDVAHEASDINIGAVLTATVVVAVVCLSTAGLMWVLQMKVLEPMAEARDPKMSPLAMPATNMPPTTLTTPTFGSAPDPKLLTNEPRYLGGVRAEWQQDLHTYGWIDQQAGVARIPIERAKALLIERGLAVRPDPATDPRLGTHAPAYGESSSGRTITRPITTEPSSAPPAAPAEHK
jgi:hypothetical protein